MCSLTVLHARGTGRCSRYRGIETRPIRPRSRVLVLSITMFWQRSNAPASQPKLYLPSIGSFPHGNSRTPSGRGVRRAALAALWESSHSPSAEGFNIAIISGMAGELCQRGPKTVTATDFIEHVRSLIILTSTYIAVCRDRCGMNTTMMMRAFLLVYSNCISHTITTPKLTSVVAHLMKQTNNKLGWGFRLNTTSSFDRGKSHERSTLRRYNSRSRSCEHMPTDRTRRYWSWHGRDLSARLS
ncbi:hypothetical protein EDD16DRAFT_926184 [Pisolithus croceorrhizus]|nr:hypothetical protein EV401DRAFT_360966 [Pisolithus croceorrhizus]KAI6119780.1 hypothetical protein EDD16DRAFT_926184 [Pisolithus croceorrhizus]